MADIKISDMTDGSALEVSDTIPIVRSGANVRVVPVQPDWNATKGLGAIANKPTLAASATTDATNADNISSGTLPADRGGAGDVSGILKADGAGAVSAAVAGTDYPGLSAENNFTAAQTQTIVKLTDGATITPNFTEGNNFQVQISDNRTLANPTGLVEGSAQEFALKVKQDTTGSRTITFDWGYAGAGGTLPTMTTTALGQDTIYGRVALYRTGEATITIATPGVVTLTAHGLDTGDPVRLTTTDTLPTGLAEDTTYYAVVVTADTLQLAASLADAAAGTTIATSGSQAGTHTLTALSIEVSLQAAWGGQ